jgi:sugar lactone lactonase YvrE
MDSASGGRLDLRFEAAGEPGALLGESPVWDHADGIWWVDIDGCRLLKTSLSTRRTQSWPTPETPGFVALAGPDRPVVGMRRGIYGFSPSTAQFERLVSFGGEGRFNDATVDATGRLWVSTMAMDAAPGRGALHVVTPDLGLRTVLTGLTTPNGLAADFGRGRLYLSDSHPEVRTIWTAACDFAAAELGPRTVFAAGSDMPGRPDGAALGSNGDLYWIAAVDGAALCGFSSDGDLACSIPLPFAAPTKLAFVDGGLVVTAKATGGHGGHLAIATGLPPTLRGPALPFWRAGAPSPATPTRT